MTSSTLPSLPALRTRLATPRLVLRPPQANDVATIRAALRKNAAHLRPFEPISPDASKLATVVATVERQRAMWRRDLQYTFYAYMADAPSLVGKVALSGIHRSAFQSCFLGYWIGEAMCGQGLATEAVGEVVRFALGPLGLHRVQAAIMPRNLPSVAVVTKLGFRREGRAERYLQIAGVWEDHDIFALTSEEISAR